MKKVDELGISSIPWYVDSPDYCPCVVTSDSLLIFESLRTTDAPTARLIAAAPELYGCLREAVIEMCHSFECCGEAPEYKCNGKQDCFVKRWRAALDRAANEGEKRNEQ